MALWERYFLKELFKILLLIVLSCTFMFVLIDYSIHSNKIHSAPFLEIVHYYLMQASKIIDFILPSALLVSVIKVLTGASTRLELVALTTGGISFRRILSPFLVSAFLMASLLYLNSQLLQPLSLSKVQKFQATHLNKNALQQKNQVHSMLMEDGSVLIYQTYQPVSEAFFDVFWVMNESQLYRIETLYPNQKIGFSVQELSRLPSGELIQLETFSEKLFPAMRFNPDALYAVSHPPKQQTIKQLAHQISWRSCQFGLKKTTDREAVIFIQFLHKLIFPLICFVVVIVPAPFCMRFGRQLPVFMIYVLSIFGLISFFTLINTSVILGENQVLTPLAALVLVLVPFTVACSWSYAKI